MKIFVVTNQKGGTGKTTTAATLWAGLNRRGHATLAIDLDAQGNLSYSAGAKQEKGRPTVFSVLLGEALAVDAIQATHEGDIMPSAPGLVAADKVFNDIGREFLLRNALRSITAYEAIVIDTPPALGILTVNALAAADRVIIPAQAEVYSMQGIREVYKAVQALTPDFNPNIGIAGILVTRYSDRANINKEAVKLLEQQAANIGTRVYSTRIREAVAVREAQISRQSLLEYAPAAKVTADYNAFIDEVEREILS